MPKIVDHDQVRALIVARAVALFAEQGFGGLGIRGLAKAVGMAKSSIYYYFQTKDALIEAVIKDVVAQDMASLEEAVAKADDLADKVRGAVAWADANEDGLATQIRILNEASREGIWTDDGSVTKAYVKSMSKILGLSVNEARMFYMQLMGVVLQRMIDGGRTKLRKELGQYADLLLSAHGINNANVARTAPKLPKVKPAVIEPISSASKSSQKSDSKASGKKKASTKKTRGRKASKAAAADAATDSDAADSKTTTRKRKTSKRSASKKTATTKAAPKTRAKKSTARKTAAKKTTTKKARTKKAATTKTRTKKAASKRTGSKKASTSASAAAKKSTSKKTRANKAAPKKAASKRKPSTKKASTRRRRSR